MPSRLANLGQTTHKAMASATSQLGELTSFAETSREIPDLPADEEAYAHVASATVKQNKLASLQTLNDVFHEFDYHHTDVIPRVDQIKMYRPIAKSMDEQLAVVVADGHRYDEAVELRDRGIRLRADFEDLQREGIANKNKTQQRYMQEAGHKIMVNKTALWDERMKALEGSIEFSKNDLAQIHDVRTEILDLEIHHQPKPRFKASSMLLESKNSEYWLCTQKRFEEAKEVRRRADLVEAKERAAHEKNVADAEERERAELRSHCADEKYKRGVVCQDRWWSSRRQGDLDLETTKQRVKNNTRDMQHMHALEGQDKPDHGGLPEFGSKMTVAKRRNFDKSSAVNRGTQMRNLIADGRAAVADLSSAHDFGDAPDGCMDYY